MSCEQICRLKLYKGIEIHADLFFDIQSNEARRQAKTEEKMRVVGYSPLRQIILPET